MKARETPPPPGAARVTGALVHLLTASGAVWGLLAIQAASDSRWKDALVWMVVSVVVDALDGSLARAFRVRESWPRIDGALLDNMIDYLNYVVVPAYLVVEAELLPSGFAWTGAGAICLSSAFQFSQTDAKTDDHFFTGFPSYWNLMVFYMIVLGSTSEINLLVVASLVVLVFVPVRYLYPTRTREYRGLTIALTGAWGLCILILLVSYPRPLPGLAYGSLTYFVYYLGLSAWLSRRVR